jgi:hypothetical protein
VPSLVSFPVYLVLSEALPQHPSDGFLRFIFPKTTLFSLAFLPKIIIFLDNCEKYIDFFPVVVV